VVLWRIVVWCCLILQYCIIVTVYCSEILMHVSPLYMISDEVAKIMNMLAVKFYITKAWMCSYVAALLSPLL